MQCQNPSAAPRCVRTRRRHSAQAAADSHAHGGVATAAPAGHGHGHGHGAGPSATGFVAEMRAVAMKLHTKEQAPKEGRAERKPESKPMPQWTPTKEGYLSFLVESKAVYDTMESLMAGGSNPMCALPLPPQVLRALVADATTDASFVNTGLERGAALAQDVAWFVSTQGLDAPVASGPGVEYAAYLRELAQSDPPAFLCHWYNVYFAHSAGGRMIGSKVGQMLGLQQALAFYAYQGEMSDHLQAVRENINAVAEGWSREDKDRCLAETSKSFELSGKLLRLIA